MSVKNALLVFVLFVGLCGVLFTSFYEKAKQESIKNLNTEQLLHARQAARGIEDFFTNWTTILTMLSETSNIKNMDKTGKESIKRLREDNNEFVRAVTRVDAKGRIIYTVPYDPNAIGRDISSQKHVREIMNTHKPVISDVFFAVQGYSTVALQVPVLKDNVYQGTIGINVNFQSLAKRYLEGIKIGKTGYAWVISRDGTELFCPVPGHVGHSVFENCKNFPSILTMAKDMLKGHEGTAVYTFDQVRGETAGIVKKHAVYVPITIGSTFWSIVVASSEDEILSSLGGFRNKLIGIMSVLLLGGLLFSYYGLKASFIIREEQKRGRAEDELRASEERYRTIVENTNDAIYIHDSDGNIIDVNENACKMVGYDRGELVGANLSKIDDPENTEYLPIRMKQLVKDNSILFEGRHMRKDGSLIPIEVSCKVVTREGKGVIQAFVRDITERKRSEEALRANQLQLTEAMDLAHIVYWESDPLAETYTFNDPFYALYGTTAEQEGGYRMTREDYAKRFIHPDDLASYYRFVEESTLRPHAEITDFERRIIRRDGEVRHILTRARIVKDDSGRAIKRYGANQDITERKRMEKAAQESEEQFRKIFEGSPIGMVTVRADFRFIRANAAFCRMLGYTEQELTSLTFKDITHPEHIAQDALHVNDLLSGKIPLYRTEKRYVRKDKGVIWGSSTVNIMRDRDDRFLYFFTTVEDITDRKQAEEAFRESKEQLQALMDAAPIPIAWANTEGKIEYINRKYHDLFGYTLEEIPTVTEWRRLAYPDPAYRETIPIYIAAYREGKDFVPYEATITCKDGSQRHVIASGTAVSEMILLMINDITERKNLESRLLQAQKMEAIGTLAGGVAHDFNNILTAIIGFASILQMDMDKDDPNMAYLNEVLASSEKAVNLTQSLLAFSRKQKIDLKPHRINGIIEQTGKLLTRLLTEDINLRVTLTPVNPAVMADITQMDQILINLATNARDAMPKGGTLCIETGTVTLDDEFIKQQGYGEPGGYAVLSVSDTGFGMDEETKEHIFEPFFTTKEVGKGTGLGLSTVYGIVKQHNGYITVDSEPNKGTAFRILFPLVHSREEETVLETQDSQGGTETILVAEDDPAVRMLIADILRRYGYTIIEATDGVEAFRLFLDKGVGIDLIVCDVVMPKMNGKEVFEEIKRSRPYMKFLFTSGYTRDVIIDKGVEDGTVDFMIKPINLREFLAKVREVLDR